MITVRQIRKGPKVFKKLDLKPKMLVTKRAPALGLQADWIMTKVHVFFACWKSTAFNAGSVIINDFDFGKIYRKKSDESPKKP